MSGIEAVTLYERIKSQLPLGWIGWPDCDLRDDGTGTVIVETWFVVLEKPGTHRSERLYNDDDWTELSGLLK